MIGKKSLLWNSVLLIAVLFLVTFTVSTAAQAATAKTVTAGTTWVVDKTTQLSSLTIGKDAKLGAPSGHSLVMTVNGVETAMKAGTYTGDIVLTVADEIFVKYSDMGKELKYYFTTAVYVDNGKYILGKSVAAAAVGGTVTDTEAKNLSITSKGDNFNGIVVVGDSKYTIDNLKIDFTGNGGNDFVGFGAGIKSSGKADVTVNSANIVTRGSIRTAIFVGEHSTMHVNNSSIEVFNGPEPANTAFGKRVAPMDQVPWGLGLTGNVRATNLVDYGTVYYNNCHIKAQGWGALSVDGAEHVRMYVTNSTIETVDSGYGAYSIGDTIDTFKHSTFNVASVGLIMAAEGSDVLTDGSVLNSKGYGVVVHSAGNGHLTIDKGSTIHSKYAAIEVKSSGVNILVDNAKIQADNGVILQAMVNDDTGAMGGPGMPAGGGAGGPGQGGPNPGGPGAGGQNNGGAAGVGQSGNPMAPGGPGDTRGPEAQRKTDPNIVATFKDVNLEGDFFNGRTGEGDLILSLENATIAGAISTTTTKPSNGKAPTSETREWIGRVVNTLTQTDEKHGLKLTLDSASKWTVSRTSYLTSLTLAKGAVVEAPQGQSLTMTVNGKQETIQAGSYQGKIVLAVALKL